MSTRTVSALHQPHPPSPPTNSRRPPNWLKRARNTRSARRPRQARNRSRWELSGPARNPETNQVGRGFNCNCFSRHSSLFMCGLQNIKLYAVRLLCLQNLWWNLCRKLLRHIYCLSISVKYSKYFINEVVRLMLENKTIWTVEILVKLTKTKQLSSRSVAFINLVFQKTNNITSCT